MVLPSFADLLKNYPFGTAAEVKTRIGGRVNADWVQNTCAIRISRALNYSGARVPRSKETISGDDGLWYIFRVRVLKRYLIDTYGNPGLLARKRAGVHVVPGSLKTAKGIIGFEVSGWSDATGHFTLWDGMKCADPVHGYFTEAHEIALWEAPAIGPGDFEIRRAETAVA